MKNGILKDVGVITVSKALGSLISFVNVALLSRFRTLAEYGTYSEMRVAVFLVVTICDLGLPYAVTYFGARTDDENDRRHFFSVFYTVDTIISFFIALAILISIPLMERYFGNPQISKYWYFLMILPWERIIGTTVDNILVILKKANLIALYRIVYSLSSLFIILIIQVLGHGFDEYMIAHTFMLAAMTLLVYVLVHKNIGGLSVSFDKEIFKKILFYTIPIGLASAVSLINVELDRFVVGHFCSVEEVAIYANASKELPVAMLSYTMNIVLMPIIVRKISQGKNIEAVSIWGRAIAISLDVLMTLTFALIVFAPEVITFIYSEKYLAGASIFRIYCLNYLIGCTYWGMVLNAKGKTKYILYSSIIACCVNVVLDLMLFRVLGMIGPAIATIFGQICLGAFLYMHSEKILNVRRIIDWDSVLNIFVRNLTIAVACYVLKVIAVSRTNINHIVLAFLIGGFWICFYLALYGKKIARSIDSLNSEKE